jgi:two-component system response regulator DevR
MARAAPQHVTTNGPRLGVVVVEPANVVRAGLALLVRSGPDMELTGQAVTADEALRTVRGLRRRAKIVVVVDLGLSGEHDAFWLIREIRERCPSFAIVGCGTNTARMAISRALFVGADGFVDLSCDPTRFLEALHRAAAKEVVLEGVPDDYIGSIVERIEIQRDTAKTLTERELQVLATAAEGLTAREIGDRLGMRERTVTTHLGHIYWKLGVAGRVEALTAAARAGLVTVGWMN